jgi:hypothetical protein
VIFACDNSTKCVTMDLNDKLSVRLYYDNKPNCLETAQLHKGLVMVYDGLELIEEGIGFGVPVVKYNDKTYFSGKAKASIKESEDNIILEKQFVLDTVSRKRFFKAYVNDDFYSLIHKLFEKGYLGHDTLLPINNKIMELRDLFKIKTDFQKVEPRGTVTTQYIFEPNKIKINVDFSKLNFKDCMQTLVLNEQGASGFGNYSDSSNLKLAGRQIGAWAQVMAKEASLTSLGGALTFTLQSSKSANLFRGWEKTKNRFSWAGLSYALDAETKLFNYTINISQR